MKIPGPGAVHDEREIEAVMQVLRSDGALDIGPAVAEFETRVAELLAKQHGVMVNSGSSALRLAIDLLGCEAGDEIITSPLTFSTDIAPMVHPASCRCSSTSIRRPTRSTTPRSPR